MQIEELMERARDGIDIRQVFGEPYERNGITIIPVARVGGGGGSGKGPPDAQGSGTGFGFKAEPAGVYVIKGDDVSWQPAVNVNRIINGAFAIAIITILRAPHILKRLRKFFR